MSFTVTRWLCADCAREWVDAWGWTPKQGCPVCHTTAIREVEFTPAFAGGDIPRDRLSAARPPASLVVIPAEENRVLSMGFE